MSLLDDLLRSYPPKTVGKYQPLGWMSVERLRPVLQSIFECQQVHVPIVRDETGEIIDGHHRNWCHRALKLRVPLLTTMVRLPSDDAKRCHAIALNLQRRQLSQAEKRTLIASELRHDPKRSNAWLATLCGVTDKTVASVRAELEAGSEIPRVTKVRGRDEKSYPVAALYADRCERCKYVVFTYDRQARRLR